MTNIKKLFVATWLTALSTVAWAGDVTFVMGSIFDGVGLSFNVTSPVAANVSSNTSKSNAKDGKLGSDGHYFQIVLSSNTFTAASINGYINTTSTSKNWAFQFSTDGGANWSQEVTQANDGNKSAHDIAVSATIPANANGFRVVRRAGTSTMVSSITLTIDGGGVTPPDPVAVIGVTLNKNSLSLEAGQDETLVATVAPSNADNKSVSWSSSDNTVASVDQTGKVSAVAAGTATITVTTADGNKTATCTVTVTAPSTTIPVTAIALNKTNTTITIGASETLTVSYTPTNANTGKAITWTSSNNNIATVNNGVVTAVAEGTATITATSEGNFTATCAVTVQAGAPVPSTGLTLHEPEVYEAKEIAGGYGGELAVFGGREYEVYYAGKTSESLMTVDVKPNQKLPGIAINNTSTSCKAPDGWFEAATTSISNYTNTAIDEFIAGTGSVHKMQGCSYKMHIKGYDQFSIQAADKNVEMKDGTFRKNQRFQIFIDNVMQPEDQASTDITVRRYNITTGEHVIEVKALGDGASLFYGFSLRIAQEPRTKYLKGNDSTQNVLQTTSPKPVYYFTKYNAQGETRLVWNGAEATGITLNIQGHGEVGDTLVLSGTAQCPVGTYHYNVISYFNGLPTRSVAGKLQVSSDLKAQNDTVIDAFQGEEMDEIIFRYYALSANDVHLQWTSAAPAGITGSGNNGKFIISGTPTQVGTYTYNISVDGSQPITGKIEVKPLDLGNNPILFLYKNNLSYEHNDVYKYLTGKGKNLIARKAKNELRPMEQYNKYKWILISEDVDADNEEVLDVIRGAANLPVLNLKGFTYSDGRLGWGYPDNGSVDTTTNNGTKIFVQREDHPIFASFSGKKQGDAIQIFKAGSGQGVMPIKVSKQKSLCLATGYTRDIDHYMSDGELQTAIHEVPASQRGGAKYICLPISGKAELTTDGQKLLDAIVTYLTTETSSSISLPELQINSFSIFGVAGKIDQNANTIEMAFNVLDYPNINLKEIVPTIQLADPKYTFVTPASGDTVNFQYSTFMPIEFVVSDYINSRVYNVTVTMYNPQGIDEVYTVGEWVNIFDVYGRKIATTNENIYSMDLPRGMYIVVTESGETIKIMR